MSRSLPAQRPPIASPSPPEKLLGLWVKDIGVSRGSGADATVRFEQGYTAVEVESGSGFYRTQRAKSLVDSGDACLCVPGVSAEFAPECEWEIRWICWDGPEAEVLESLGYVPTRRGPIPGAANTVARALLAVADVAESDLSSAPLQRKAVILSLVDELLRAERRRYDSVTPQGKLTVAVQYLKAHYVEDVKAEKLAQLVNVSPTHFRRLFRKRTGLALVQYITRLRMRKAMILLIDGSSVKETAYRSGFEDEYYFTRVFHRIVGTTPTAFVTEFRHIHGKNGNRDSGWRQRYVSSLIQLPC